MLIRNMKKSDYAEVDRLLLQIHQMDVSNRPDMFSPADQYMAQECYENLVDSPTVISILAQKHRNVLGCCFVSMLGKEGSDENRTAYIDLLVVDEPHRRKGIGKALFQEVQKRAKKNGCPSSRSDCVELQQRCCMRLRIVRHDTASKCI